MINRIKKLIFGSLKIELVIVIVISIIISSSVISWSVSETKKENNKINNMISEANELFVGVTRFVTRNDDGCKKYLDNLAGDYQYNMAITDNEGNIALKSSGVGDRIDYMDLLKNKDHIFSQRYEVRVDNKEMLLFVWKTYDIKNNEKLIVMGTVLPIILVLICIYYFINRKVNYIKYIAKNIEVLAQGNLDNILEKRGRDELNLVAKKINFMAKSLKEKIEKDKKRENLKNELITNVSHDLRTPLTSLIGYLTLIDDKKTIEENKNQYIKTALKKSERLKFLLEDLFEYSKLESKEITIDKEEVNVVEIINQCIGEHEVEAKNKKMKFIKDYICNELFLNIDANKIARAFENIIINAIKYGDEASEIIIQTFESGENIKFVFKNKVKNSKVSNINRIFDRFYRGDESRNSKISGSGLGLAIVKSIIELHNGDVKAEFNNDTIKIIVSLKK